MKLIKTFIASLLAIVMISAPVSGESMLKEILSSGVLKAGTTGDFFPFSKRDTATNDYVGYDIDILKEPRPRASTSWYVHCLSQNTRYTVARI